MNNKIKKLIPGKLYLLKRHCQFVWALHKEYNTLHIPSKWQWQLSLYNKIEEGTILLFVNEHCTSLEVTQNYFLLDSKKVCLPSFVYTETFLRDWEIMS